MDKKNRYVIRHSDIQLFLQCRNKWDFSSPLRLSYRPYVAAKQLDVGSAWAEAMEAYYEPVTWYSDHKRAAALAAYIRACEDQREQIYQNSDHTREVVDAEIAERIELGKGMLKYFFRWSQLNDEFLEPIAVEMDFEVPILEPSSGKPLAYCPSCELLWSQPETPRALNGECTEVPVVFQGRIDRLLLDKRNGNYWLGEDKTAEKWADADWLAIDPQTTRYMWALKQAKGIDVLGMFWTQSKKEYPQPPKINANGAVSVDKRQCTTAHLFDETVAWAHDFERNEEAVPLTDKLAEKYSDFRDYLLVREANDLYGRDPWLIRRIKQPISPDITEQMGAQLYTYACEMLDNPRIYPNATSFNCGRCPYKEACIMRHEGQDWKWVLDHKMEVRGRDERK